MAPFGLFTWSALCNIGNGNLVAIWRRKTILYALSVIVNDMGIMFKDGACWRRKIEIFIPGHSISSSAPLTISDAQSDHATERLLA